MICIQFAGCNHIAIIAMLCLCLTCGGFTMGGFQVNHLDLSPNFAGKIFLFFLFQHIKVNIAKMSFHEFVTNNAFVLLFFCSFFHFGSHVGKPHLFSLSLVTWGRGHP